MGASSDEIDRELDETRESIDAKLIALRQTTESRARRYAPVAVAVAAGGLALAGGVAAVVYMRRRRQRSRPVYRLHKLRDDVLAMKESVQRAVDNGMPRVHVDVASEDGYANAGAGPSGWRKYGLKFAGAAGGAAGSALVGIVAHRFIGRRASAA